MYVFGSADLSRSLMQARLFDEYRIGIAPVIYGKGRPLFGKGLDTQQLRLGEARRLSNGCVILRYLA
jgi:dihydrofolate reductase